MNINKYMKKNFFVIFLIFLMILPLSTCKNKKNQSKFEKLYQICKDGSCKDRFYDDNCIYQCISFECYHKIYDLNNRSDSNNSLFIDVYFIEFGEFDSKKRFALENCLLENKK